MTQGISEKSVDLNNEKKDKSETDTTVNTDGKGKYDWISRYPKEAQDVMFWEAVYLFFIGFATFIILVLVCCGYSTNLFVWLGCSRTEYYPIGMYLSITYFSGMLGGVVFGAKYFYRVIARGYWSVDRKYWRYFSPWLSGIIGLIVGVMSLSDLLGGTMSFQLYRSAILIGFFSGYFADEAIGKMAEIANVIFGKK